MFARHLERQKLFNSEALEDRFANPVGIALEAGLPVAGDRHSQGLPEEYVFHLNDWAPEKLKLLVVTGEKESASMWAARRIFYKSTWLNAKKYKAPKQLKDFVYRCMCSVHTDRDDLEAAELAPLHAVLQRIAAAEPTSSGRPSLQQVFKMWMEHQLTFLQANTRRVGTSGGISSQRRTRGEKRGRTDSSPTASSAEAGDLSDTHGTDDDSSGHDEASSHKQARQAPPLPAAEAEQGSPVTTVRRPGVSRQRSGSATISSGNRAAEIPPAADSSSAARSSSATGRGGDHHLQSFTASTHQKAAAEHIEQAVGDLMSDAQSELAKRITKLEDRSEQRFERLNNTLLSVLGALKQLQDTM